MKVLTLLLVLSSVSAFANSPAELAEGETQITYDCGLEVELQYVGRELTAGASNYDSSFVVDLKKLVQSKVFNYAPFGNYTSKLQAKSELTKNCIALAGFQADSDLERKRDWSEVSALSYSTLESSTNRMTKEKVVLGGNLQPLTLGETFEDRKIEHTRFCQNLIKYNMACEEVRKIEN